MPGSGAPSRGQEIGLIAILLVVGLGFMAYLAFAPLFGWPSID
jgi:hypothetical protein